MVKLVLIYTHPVGSNLTCDYFSVTITRFLSIHFNIHLNIVKVINLRNVLRQIVCDLNPPPPYCTEQYGVECDLFHLTVYIMFLFPLRDVVKLTAQFVAKNGKSFLQTLIQKEQKNYLFDFLRPQHGHFQYFTKLVEQYSKVWVCCEVILIVEI